MSKPVSGVQLFTLRDFCKTVPDLQTTLKRVADIGYTTVQVSGVAVTDDEAVAQAARDAGLEIAITHMSWESFENDLEGVIKRHKIFNCKHTAIGMAPKRYFEPGGLELFIEDLRPIAKRLAEEGMDFSYHNHNNELVKHGNSTWLQTLYEKSGPEILKAEIDTYWIQAGGADPAKWVEFCADRMPVLHVKDMTIAKEREQRFAPVGEGNLNWERILSAAEKSNVKYLMVEQDRCFDDDPFDCIAKSYKNLKAMGYP
jgi:sugar phosphate isomerase/epimerase